MLRAAMFLPSLATVLMGGLSLHASATLASEAAHSLSPTIVVHEMHHRQKHATPAPELKSRYAAHIRHWFSCSNSVCLSPVPPRRSHTIYAGGGCAPGISAVQTTRYGDERDFECFMLDQ